MMDFMNDRGKMEIMLAGRPLTLRYSINSLCDLEDRAGMPLDRLMNRQFTATRLLLWAGLRQCQPDLTVWDVGELIGEYLQAGGSLEGIIKLCADGLQEAGLLGEAGWAI